jgi:hypothetical protein
MATVNFSVPEEVKQRFNKRFEGRNKSAIISQLMVRAIEEEDRRERRRVAMAELIQRSPLREGLTSESAERGLDEMRGQS